MGPIQLRCLGSASSGSKLLLFVLAAAIALVAAACNRGQDVDAAALLEESLKAMQGLSSFHLSEVTTLKYSREGREDSITTREIDFRLPREAVGAVNKKSGDKSFQYEIAATDDQVFVFALDKNTGRWDRLDVWEDSFEKLFRDPTSAPSLLFHPVHQGIYEDVKMRGIDDLEGTPVYRLSAKGTTRYLMIGALIAEFNIEFWIGTDDKLLRRVTLSKGRIDLPGVKADHSTRFDATAHFSAFNVPVRIEIPVASAKPEVSPAAVAIVLQKITPVRATATRSRLAPEADRSAESLR